jgi:DNA-binding NtrC family response regulator
MTSTGPTRKRNVMAVRKGLLRPKHGEPVPVDDAPLLIGRNPQCHVVLDDAEVSGAHCEVRAGAEGLLLRDLGSKNGTFVGGLRVREAWLTAACTIRIGGSAIDFEPLGREHAELASVERFGPLIGATAVMRRVFRILAEVAPTEISVLLTGETGTGKQLGALAIHGASPRAKKPFAVLDCGAIPASLAESWLFGHEKGAFTGAVRQTDGVFREADGGTLFLDEIGELPLEVQPKLLRALDERKVKRVGGSKYDSIDVRFVSATHRDLARRTNTGAFREDLFFRIAQMPVELPPLRDRRADIPLIARAVCEERGKGERAEEINALLERELAHRQWRGNVRELVQLVKAVADLPPGAESLEIVLGTGEEREGSSPAGAFTSAKREANEAFERGYWTKLAVRCKGNISEMARESGVERHKVRGFMRKYGISKDV